MLDYKSIKYFKQAVNASSYNETPLDVSCKCPICGDSKAKANSKRLHLYKKGDLELINCFNAGCACENKTVYSFLRDFFPGMLPQYKRETFAGKMETLKREQPQLLNTTNTLNTNTIESDWTNSVPLQMNTETPETVIDTSSQNLNWMDSTEDLHYETEIGPVLYNLEDYFKDLTPEYSQYLLNRGIRPTKEYKIGKSDIKINKTTYKIKDFLIIPLFKDKLMYGFYSRSIKEKTFITFISTTGYKVWNWYFVNKQEPVYIFEAIFDAISTDLSNIIANLGAKLPQERLSELLEPIFCLDNDKTGLEMSIQYAQQGHKVFVMPNNILEKDFNELKLNQPDLNIPELIKSNIFTGIGAITRLKLKL